MVVQRKQSDGKVKFIIAPEVRAWLDRYIASRNAVPGPSKFTITGVVNQAIREYLERNDGTDERAA